MATATKTQSSGATRLLMCFMDSVKQVFRDMAGVEVTVGQPALKSQSDATYAICGIIGLSGEVTGSMVVSFSESAAVKLVEAFAGVAIARDTPDFADAIGELANIIAGNAKHHFGGSASISLPTVVIGAGYTVAGASKLPCLVIPCDSPFGAFTVEVCIQKLAD